MQPFEHASPKTLAEAVALLSEGALLLAGGTDLLSLMKDGLRSPRRLVSLKSVPELRGVSHDEQSGLRIGAMTTLAELYQHSSLHQRYPSLAQAIAGIHSAQIQNMGTAGGDLLQWPRCWYYRNGFGLLAPQVRDGENRYHAIFGNDGAACFVNASSLAPALGALGARVKLYGPKGEREVAVDALYRTPKAEDEALSDLLPQEVLTEILVPPAEAGPNATYEVRQREALDWPLVAAAVSLKTDGQSRVTAARVVLGHVAPVPWPAPEAEKALIGGVVDEAAAEKAATAAVQGATPLSGNAYKVRLARVAVKRAILRAMGTEV